MPSNVVLISDGTQWLKTWFMLNISKFPNPNHCCRFTLALMQWGQYLDHDLTSTPMERSANGSILDCSRCDSLRQNSACFPIIIGSTDTFYGTAVKRCIPFTRSLPGQLSLGPREQVNRVTPLLDASSVYGSTQVIIVKGLGLHCVLIFLFSND